MSLPILAILKASAWSQSEKIGWNKRGVGAIRVDTMQEGIERLEKERFLFIIIDADNITYMPLLHIMHDRSNAPIFIGTNRFSIADEVEALHNGADAYVPFQHYSEDNVMLALAFLHSYNERIKQAKDAPPVIPYNSLLVFPECRLVFCHDMEINLTKKEFDLLLYFLANRGCILSHEQIYDRVWGLGYEGTDPKALYNNVQRLRNKLAQATGTNGYIENVKDVGYRLPHIGGNNGFVDACEKRALKE